MMHRARRLLLRCTLAVGGALCVFAVLSETHIHAAEGEVPQSQVGLSAQIEGVVLPGSELEPRPWDDRKVPIIVRIEATYPHGDAFRYDLVFFGLEPGRYFLREYLQRKDGSSTGDLPPLPVDVVSVLPEGHVAPHDLAETVLPRVGGYRAIMWGGIVAWLVGIVAILFVRRRHRIAQAAAVRHVPTLVERLRPIVEDALQGRLAPDQQAELERLLLSYWRRRLQLEDLKAADAIAQLREHEEAGAVLRQLELWLHHPSARQTVDVATLLRPYQNLPAEESPVDRTPLVAP